MGSRTSQRARDMKANLTRLVPVTTEAVGLIHHFNGFPNDKGFIM